MTETRLNRHADAIANHGERISAVEATVAAIVVEVGEMRKLFSKTLLVAAGGIATGAGIGSAIVKALELGGAQ